ncbi:MAG: phosphoribosylaminoimidazolesuccinocarboxamide synthase [Planctomycetota bacterium]
MTRLPDPVLAIHLPGVPQIGSGKVREIYDLGDDLLLVTSDRVSAFDVVMREGIRGKGIVLNRISAFFFDLCLDLCPNHMLSIEVDDWPEIPDAVRPVLRGRTMRCRKAEPLPVEWVVRGYLTGSGFKDYKRDGAVSGVALPPGLEHASRLEPAILTPSTKAETGHDEPISFDRVVDLIGRETAERCRDLALAIYARGHDHAREHGFVLADTKFEFGLRDGEVWLIDECLTPDSSRYWPAAQVAPGAYPESYDKQVVRDYLSGLDWDKTPPPPPLPAEVRDHATRRYLEIYEALTGQPLPEA